MKTPALVFLLFVVAIVQSGCLIAPSAPMCAEDRAVRIAHDPAKSVTVIEGMVFGDFKNSHGIRFPGGSYVLESEDETYLYFAAPAPLEYRVFSGGKPVDGRFIPGGLAIAKNTFRVVPAAGYMNAEQDKKTFTWKLGSEFLSLEGTRWTKSY